MTKNITPEDAHLWHLNTQDVKPLSQETKIPLLKKKNRVQEAIPQVVVKATPPPFSVPFSVPSSPLPSLEKKVLRHLKIDARLDMHGLSLAAGYSVLEEFLQRAHHRGFKIVLVITGKGSLSAENTLRRQVPRWVEETALRHWISSLHHPAKLQDGGTGAFYMKVRRAHKTRQR